MPRPRFPFFFFPNSWDREKRGCGKTPYIGNWEDDGGGGDDEKPGTGKISTPVSRGNVGGRSLRFQKSLNLTQRKRCRQFKCQATQRPRRTWPADSATVRLYAPQAAVEEHQERLQREVVRPQGLQAGKDGAARYRE
jgi:hypothetical protein